MELGGSSRFRCRHDGYELARAQCLVTHGNLFVPGHAPASVESVWLRPSSAASATYRRRIWSLVVHLVGRFRVVHLYHGREMMTSTQRWPEHQTFWTARFRGLPHAMCLCYRPEPPIWEWGASDGGSCARDQPAQAGLIDQHAWRAGLTALIDVTHHLVAVTADPGEADQAQGCVSRRAHRDYPRRARRPRSPALLECHRSSQPLEPARDNDNLLATEGLGDVLPGVAVLAHALDEVEVSLTVDVPLAEEHFTIAAQCQPRVVERPSGYSPRSRSMANHGLA
jgi:hypothetical protein